MNFTKLHQQKNNSRTKASGLLFSSIYSSLLKTFDFLCCILLEFGFPDLQFENSLIRWCILIIGIDNFLNLFPDILYFLFTCIFIVRESFFASVSIISGTINIMLGSNSLIFFATLRSIGLRQVHRTWPFCIRNI